MLNVFRGQRRARSSTLLAVLVVMVARGVEAQAPARPPATSCVPSGQFAPPRSFLSVEQLDDSRVTFRLCAPDATTASVTSADADPAIPMGEKIIFIRYVHEHLHQKARDAVRLRSA